METQVEPYMDLLAAFPEGGMSKIRVVLADDHQAMLARVREELGEHFEVVAAVSNGAEALKAIAAFDPDVLVADISMPVLDGLQTATSLRANKNRAKRAPDCLSDVGFGQLHDDARASLY